MTSTTTAGPARDAPTFAEFRAALDSADPAHARRALRYLFVALSSPDDVLSRWRALDDVWALVTTGDYPPDELVTSGPKRSDPSEGSI